MMTRLRALLLVGALLLAGALSAQREGLELGPRALRAVARYQQLVKELDLSRLPTDAPDYSLVSGNVDHLGGQMEALSRLALETEASLTPDWAKLQNALQAFENDLTQLGCQSLRLRVWSSQERQGAKKPQWGLAVSASPTPLPAELGRFDADVPEALALTLKPGERQWRQILVVPLAKALAQVRAEVKALPARGAALPAGSLSLLPVDVARLPQGETADWWQKATRVATPEVAAGQSQAFILVVTIPADQKPGEYAARLRFDPQGGRPQGLDVNITVP